MKKKLLSLSVVALLASMMFGTVALASEQEDVATGTDAVVEVAADENTTEIEATAEVADVTEELVEDVEENIIDANKGWVQIGNDWYYYNDQGVKVTGWSKIGAYWFHFQSTGVMNQGWYKEGGYWYYLGANGKMRIGWEKIGTTWYYFTPEGKMVTKWRVISGKWYYFSDEGKMLTGWQQISGSWYYLEDGAMISNCFYQLGGKLYKFSANGKLFVGWYQEGSEWYYFDTYGITTGWKKIGGYWYYFHPSYWYMITGSYKINGTLHFFKDNGRYEGTNSVDNHCEKNKSRNYYDYENGEISAEPLDVYYNGKNQIVLDIILINRLGYKVDYIDEIYITVVDADGKKIAQQAFSKRNTALSNNKIMDLSFTFDQSVISDLRRGVNVYMDYTSHGIKY